MVIDMVMTIRSVTVALGLLVLSAQAVSAQETFSYREFQMGSDLASVAKLTGTLATAAKLVHARPVDMKDLEWRPRNYSGATSPQSDPVDMMLFRFYDNQLFKVIVDYDRRRTEGMSAADMIEAITETYGPISQVPSRQLGTPTVQYGFPDTPLAVWGNSDYSVTLLRVAYPAAFRLVVASTRLDDLARTASLSALRLDAAEAPQRERDRQKREADASAAAQEKAKTENKAQFRP
jgi:hypothetical protein